MDSTNSQNYCYTSPDAIIHRMASLFSSASTWSCSTIPQLASKVFLVTGGTAGIGFGITANLLSHNPERVYMLSELPEHADLAKKELQKYGDASKVEYINCDLRDLRQVDSTAKELSSKLTRLDGLICNAGCGVGVYNESKDGIGGYPSHRFGPGC